MKAWLESVVDALQDGAAGKKLASALCVTHCLPKVGIYNLKIERFCPPTCQNAVPQTQFGEERMSRSL